jgi:hypothetical protein
LQSCAQCPLFKKNYERLGHLISEIEPYPKKAISNLSKITVPNAEIEQVKENVGLRQNRTSPTATFVIGQRGSSLIDQVSPSASLSNAREGIRLNINQQIENSLLGMEERIVSPIDAALRGLAPLTGLGFLENNPKLFDIPKPIDIDSLIPKTHFPFEPPSPPKPKKGPEK